MPTPEEIKKICAEYAKCSCPESVYRDSEKLFEDRSQCIVEAMPFIQWLSERYCIVPKKSVAEWVNDIEFFMPDKRSVTMLKIGAKSLFGKELFNEE